MRTGYVEAVATWPEQQRNGYATEVMGAVARVLDERYELGALDTGLSSFYGGSGGRCGEVEPPCERIAA